MQIFIKDIESGERLRQDMGDIDGLAKSIKEHGLLHPIVIAEPTEYTDGKYRLVAGGRRLEACKQLGIEIIEAKNLKYISARELRIVELEENIRRKDLTEYEKSRDLTEMVEITKEVIRSETREVLLGTDKINEGFSDSEKKSEVNCADSAHLNNPNKIGLRTVSERIGVPFKTIHDAQQHVAAVDKYPELVDFPKHKAIESAKTLDKAPEDKQTELIRMIKEDHRKIDKEHDMSDEIFKLIYAGYGKVITEEKVGLYLEHTHRPLDDHIRILDETIKNLQTIRSILTTNRGFRVLRGGNCEDKTI